MVVVSILPYLRSIKLLSDREWCLENRRRSHRPCTWTNTKYSRGEIFYGFSIRWESSVSFKEVVEESVRQIFEGKGMSAFQQALRNGMNQICCAIQQRVYWSFFSPDGGVQSTPLSLLELSSGCPDQWSWPCSSLWGPLPLFMCIFWPWGSPAWRWQNGFPDLRRSGNDLSGFGLFDCVDINPCLYLDRAWTPNQIGQTDNYSRRNAPWLTCCTQASGRAVYYLASIL